jgi:hypothetical protein
MESRPGTVPGFLTDSDFLAALDEDDELHLSTAARPLRCTLPQKLVRESEETAPKKLS